MCKLLALMSFFVLAVFASEESCEVRDPSSALQVYRGAGRPLALGTQQSCIKTFNVMYVSGRRIVGKQVDMVGGLFGYEVKSFDDFLTVLQKPSASESRNFMKGFLLYCLLGFCGKTDGLTQEEYNNIYPEGLCRDWRVVDKESVRQHLTCSVVLLGSESSNKIFLGKLCLPSVDNNNVCAYNCQNNHAGLE